jgi:hypothetical protein
LNESLTSFGSALREFETCVMNGENDLNNSPFSSPSLEFIRTNLLDGIFPTHQCEISSLKKLVELSGLMSTCGDDFVCEATRSLSLSFILPYALSIDTFYSTFLCAISSLPLPPSSFHNSCKLPLLRSLGKYGLLSVNKLIGEYAGLQYGKIYMRYLKNLFNFLIDRHDVDDVDDNSDNDRRSDFDSLCEEEGDDDDDDDEGDEEGEQEEQQEEQEEEEEEQEEDNEAQ